MHRAHRLLSGLSLIVRTAREHALTGARARRPGHQVLQAFRPEKIKAMASYWLEIRFKTLAAVDRDIRLAARSTLSSGLNFDADASRPRKIRRIIGVKSINSIKPLAPSIKADGYT